jgi:hypothetical protein
MELHLPLYAVQRLADGTWLVRTLMCDPILPAVDVVAVVGEPTSAAPRAARAACEPKAPARQSNSASVMRSSADSRSARSAARRSSRSATSGLTFHQGVAPRSPARLPLRIAQAHNAPHTQCARMPKSSSLN